MADRSPNRIALPSRLQGGAIDRRDDLSCWIVWLHTNDYKLGTALHLYDDGRVERVTHRVDEGDEVWTVRL